MLYLFFTIYMFQGNQSTAKLDTKQD